MRLTTFETIQGLNNLLNDKAKDLEVNGRISIRSAIEWLGDLDKENMKHYKQGRADEKAEREGRLMQTFSPD